MTTTDKLTDEQLEGMVQEGDAAPWVSDMARELLTHRRASHAAPAPVAWRYPYRGSWEYSNSSVRPNRYEAEPLYAAPAPSDGLREAAQALVDRWDSPVWGGSADKLRHTGEYIAALRAALSKIAQER